jgi:DNA helicase-2/ATP-dependent DNA helicase PcrA
MNLNPEQQAVIDSTANQILVLAGPGSGKTKTLMARIFKLIERGASSHEIVCITYTRSAASEIQKRLGESLLVQRPEQAGPVLLGFTGTLHAFAFKMLSEHGNLIGLPAKLSIADDDLREDMIESIAAEMGVKCSAKGILPLLSEPEMIDPHPGKKTRNELVAIAYHRTLKSAGLLDFDSLLYYFLELIQYFVEAPIWDKEKSVPEWPFKCLLVDEVQDSSDADMAIYKAMPCGSKLLCGDPDQSIYKFRGGNVENIIGLTGGTGWHVFTLEKNHRCKNVIADAAQRLIQYNELRYPKQTVAVDKGGAVVVESFATPAEEMAFIANELTANHNSQSKVSRNGNDTCAVLCRTNAISKQIGTYLKSVGIGVAERKEIVVPKDWKKTKLLLSVMANPHSDFLVHQFLVAAEGKKKADMIRLKAAGTMDSINAYLAGKFTATLDSSIMEDWKISMESRQRIRDAARSLSCIVGEWTVPELILFINSQEDTAQEIGEGVHVGTIHGSKGREYNCVYLAGFEHEVIPGKKDDDISESRRLAFVGMTRAKQRLLITYCHSRPQNRGPNMEPGPMETRTPSRFISEMGLTP